MLNGLHSSDIKGLPNQISFFCSILNMQVLYSPLRLHMEEIQMQQAPMCMREQKLGGIISSSCINLVETFLWIHNDIVALETEDRRDLRE